MKIYELINKQANAQEITSESYQEFVDIQNDFFELLTTFGKDSAESLGNIDFLTGSYADASLYKAKQSGRNKVLHHELAYVRSQASGL